MVHFLVLFLNINFLVLNGTYVYVMMVAKSCDVVIIFIECCHILAMFPVPATLIFIGLDPVIIGTKHNFQSLLWLSFLATAGAKYSGDF